MTTNMIEGAVATNETTILSGAVNAPVESTKTNDILSKEITEHIKTLDTLIKDLAKNFVKIGFELHCINSNKYYKELGFKTFDDFVKTQYGFSRSTAYNFINVMQKYCVRDDHNAPTKLLKKEYQKYSSSQLVAMLHLNEDAIAQIDPKTSIREIKKLEKSLSQESEAENSDDGSEETSAKEEPKKSKPNFRDTTLPVFRTNMVRGMTWDEAVTDAVKRVCESYLTSERREKDGKNYQIEINIVYPIDESIVSN